MKQYKILLLVFMLIISSYNVLSIGTTNLIGYYGFENVLDDSTGTTTGTATNTAYTPGKNGQGYLFDGTAVSNRYVSITNVTTYIASTNLTLSFWTNYTGTTGGGDYDAPFSTRVGTASNSGVRVEFNGGDTMAYGWGGAGGDVPNINKVEINNGLNLLTFVFIFNSNSTTTVKSYVNATLKNTATIPVTRVYFDKILLGRGYDNADARTWKGTIDELSVWNKDLTLTEVQELYNSGNGLSYSDLSAVANTTTFISQTPADLTVFNILNEMVNVTYNITLPNLNYSSVFLNYTVINGQRFVNGSSYGTQYNKLNYTYNTTNRTFVFSIDGDTLLSGTYNFFIEDTEDYTHNLETLNNNDILLTKILNVRNTTPFNFLEVYLNTTGNSNVYYCNETYTVGNPAINTNCFLLSSFTGTGFNHTHNQSRHNIIPFPINTTSGKIGTVPVTNTSYILIRGNTNNAYVGYINNITRNNQVKRSTNIGATYSNFSGTTDLHIHQFNTDTLSYSVFANNGTQINSTWRNDVLGYFNVPPTSVVFSNPINDTQRVSTQFFNITYSQAIATEGVTISSYNITLLNNDSSYNSTLNITPSNLYYNWNVYNSNLALGTYYIKVTATDSNGLTSQDISSSINITRNGYINITAKKINVNTTVTNFSINISNVSAGINNEVYTTTNGVILADIVKGYTYDVFVDATGYAYNSTTKTTPVTYNNLTFYLFTTNSFNIRFYDEVTLNLLSGINISLGIISDAYSNNYTTTNGTLYLDLLSPSTYTFRYKSGTDYPERTYVVDLIDREAININLYLVNSTTVITLNVKDEDDNTLENAYIKVLRYDISTNAYTVREIIKTNVEGNAYFSAILNTEFYKFIVEYPFGNEVLVTSPDYIRSTSLTLRVNLETNPLSTYYTSINTYANLSFTTSTNNFNYYYNDATNTATMGCLYIYRTIGVTSTLINSSCVSSSSGTILLGVTNTSGYTYTAQGTIQIGDTEYLLKTLTKTFDTITVANTKNNFFFLTLILTAVLGLLFIWNITVALIVVPLPLFFMSIAGMLPIDKSVGVTLLLISLTLAFIISKKA